jgi:hypothetical protein
VQAKKENVNKRLEAAVAKESTDYKNFRKNVVQPGDRCDRIENLMVVGMPDINLCIGATEVWIEQKSPTEPKRKATPLFGSNHKVSQDQANWMLRQRKAGGLCYFLISTDKRWILVGGFLADQLNKLTVDEIVDQAVWSTMKPVKDKEQWQTLRTTLQRKQS